MVQSSGLPIRVCAAKVVAEAPTAAPAPAIAKVPNVPKLAPNVAGAKATAAIPPATAAPKPRICIGSSNCRMVRYGLNITVSATVSIN